VAYIDGDELYLKNSGRMGLLWAGIVSRFCNICEVEGYPNIYQWMYLKPHGIFSLHIKDGQLTDCCVPNMNLKNDCIQDSCYIIFTEYIRAPTEFIFK